MPKNQNQVQGPGKEGKDMRKCTQPAKTISSPEDMERKARTWENTPSLPMEYPVQGHGKGGKDMGKSTQSARTNNPLIRLLGIIAETDVINYFYGNWTTSITLMGTGKSRNLYSFKAISRIAETEYIWEKAKPLGKARTY